jgi:hypothetical protein
VPQPDSVDDTSYFISRFTQFSSGMPDDQDCSNSDSDTEESYSNSGVEVDMLLFLSTFMFTLPIKMHVLLFH